MWWLCDNVDVSVCSSIHLVNSHEQNIKARNLNIKNSRNEMQSFLNKQNRKEAKVIEIHFVSSEWSNEMIVCQLRCAYAT